MTLIHFLYDEGLRTEEEWPIVPRIGDYVLVNAVHLERKVIRVLWDGLSLRGEDPIPRVTLGEKNS